MALYVTRPRRDEERIGRGLPSAVCVCFMLSDSAIISCSVKDLHCRTSCKDVDCVDFCALKNILCLDTQNCQWLSQEAETDGTHVYVEYSELGSIMLWSCEELNFFFATLFKTTQFLCWIWYVYHLYKRLVSYSNLHVRYILIIVLI